MTETVHNSPASGGNDDSLSSGLNDENLNQDDENLDDGDEEQDEEEVEGEGDDESEESEESQEPPKDEKFWKKKFNSAMGNIRKMESELKQIKSSKQGGPQVSDEDLNALREKYDEEDLEVIQRLIQKSLKDHDSNNLVQRETNIFLKEHPEVTDSQLKHLKWMQKEFEYSLKYAYEITFGKGGSKSSPKDHSIRNSMGGDNIKPKSQQQDKLQVENDEAYKDMMNNYVPH